MSAIECTGCGKGYLFAKTITEEQDDDFTVEVTHILCNECGASFVDETCVSEAEYVQTQHLARALGVTIKPNDVIGDVWAACIERTRMLRETTKQMRQHQVAYFKTRSPDELQASKKAEREVDRLLVEIEPPKAGDQGKLFR